MILKKKSLTIFLALLLCISAGPANAQETETQEKPVSSQPVSSISPTGPRFKAVEDCVSALNSPDRVLNWEAISNADNPNGVCRDPRLIRPLLHILELEDKEAFARVPNDTVLGYTDVNLKRSVLWQIGSYKEFEKEVVPTVIHWLSSKSPIRRRWACEILAAEHSVWLVTDSRSVTKEEPKLPPHALPLVLKLFNDQDFEIQLAAIQAAGIFGEEAVQPLLDKLKQSRPRGGIWRWFSRAPHKKIRQVEAISRAFIIMADRLKCVPCANKALPQLNQYLDARKASEKVLYDLVRAALRLSYTDPPHSIRLALPIFERLEKQHAQGLTVPYIARGKTAYLKALISMHEPISKQLSRALSLAKKSKEISDAKDNEQDRFKDCYQRALVFTNEPVIGKNQYSENIVTLSRTGFDVRITFLHGGLAYDGCNCEVTVKLNDEKNFVGVELKGGVCAYQ